jgi:hypothetical protein
MILSDNDKVIVMNLAPRDWTIRHTSVYDDDAAKDSDIFLGIGRLCGNTFYSCDVPLPLFSLKSPLFRYQCISLVLCLTTITTLSK